MCFTPTYFDPTARHPSAVWSQSLNHVCTDVLKCALICEVHVILRLWFLVSPSRCKQKSETEAVVTARAAVCVLLHEKIYFEAVVTLNGLPLFLTRCNAFPPPPGCFDIALVFCLCVVVCRLMWISIHGTQILYSFTYFPSDLSLCSWLTSLSVQWSL